MALMQTYKSNLNPDWCPGCGDYGILNAALMAFAELKLDPYKTVVVGGIGCSGKIPHYFNVHGVHTLHGRAVTFASGLKLANPELTVVVFGGDGDQLGIGVGHFVSVGRRNIDITIIIHNNQVYGLTKGQASPTLPRGIKTKALPMPNMQDPINPVRLALASGYTFVARGYAYNVQHLKEVIKKAIQHKGLSVVEVLQPCPTYNDVYTKEVYAQKVAYLEKEFPDWDPVVKSPEEASDKIKRAWDLSDLYGDKIYAGVFYQNPHVPTYEERIANRIPGYLKIPPAKVPIQVNGKPIASVEHILKPRMV